MAHSKSFKGKSSLLFLLCLLLLNLASQGQKLVNSKGHSQKIIKKGISQNKIYPLTIGDKVPDIEFDSILNYPSKNARLSDFKGGLTIMDFWSSPCSSCIAYIPHMQLLQNKFKNNLRIILVNSQSTVWHDNETKIRGILQRLQEKSDISIQLPVVFNCTILDKYFPAQRLPLEVWLNEERKVIAITGAEEVTAANIQAILEGKQLAMHMKHDVSLDLQTHTLSELIYGTSPRPATPLSSSVVVKGIIDGLGSGIGVRHADTPSKALYTAWYVTNLPLLDIYQAAYQDKIQCPANQVLVEAHNPGRFRETADSDTSPYSNLYSCDITMPPAKLEELMEYVQSDLERTFHATIIKEKRSIKCFVLKTTSQVTKSFSKGGPREYRMEAIDAKKYVHNYPISELIRDLNVNYFKRPLIDATDLTKRVDIDMPYELSQHNIILALEKAGFEVKEEEREMNVGVIIDK